MALFSSTDMTALRSPLKWPVSLIGGTSSKAGWRALGNAPAPGQPTGTPAGHPTRRGHAKVPICVLADVPETRPVSLDDPMSRSVRSSQAGILAFWRGVLCQPFMARSSITRTFPGTVS